jgi:two-component system sensor histidine kinase/response regulator
MKYILKKYLLLLTAVVLAIHVKAQNDVSLLSKKFTAYLKSDKDSTLYFLNQVQKAADLNKTYEDEYINLKGLYTYYWENNIKGAYKLFNDALLLAKQNKDTNNYYGILRNKSNAERDFGNTDKAFELLAQCADYYKKKDNLKSLAGVYNSMALTMLYSRNEAEAEKYFKLALPLLEKYKLKENLASTQIGLATTLFTLKKNKEGLVYLDKAKKSAIEIGDSLALADCYKEEGTEYFDNDDIPKATSSFETAKAIYLSHSFSEPLGVVYTNLYTCYANLNNMQKAKVCLDSGLYYVHLFGQTDLLVTTKWYEADYYKRIGNYKKAFETFERYTAEKDSVFGKENTDKINELNIKYKSVEKDNELLKDKTDITEKNFLIQKQNTRIYFISALFILTVLIVVLTSYLVRKQRRLNKELSELNDFKNNVFTIISHDLRSPISSIVNNNSDAKNKALSALNILDNLLHWSYPQLNKSQLTPVKIILSKIIEEVINQTAYLVNSKNQRVRVNMDEAFTFTGDYDTTLVILRNLLTNASKYANESETILISQTGNEISIVNTCSEVIEAGTGIGIKLCEDLAKQNNYKLRIEFNNNVATAYLQIHA